MIGSLIKGFLTNPGLCIRDVPTMPKSDHLYNEQWSRRREATYLRYSLEIRNYYAIFWLVCDCGINDPAEQSSILRTGTTGDFSQPQRADQHKGTAGAVEPSTKGSSQISFRCIEALYR